MIYMDASFGPGAVDPSTGGNTIERNIFFFASAQKNYSMIGAAVPLPPGVVRHELSGGVQRNLYFNANGLLFDASTPSFMNYTWAEWQHTLGSGSMQGHDPQFVHPVMGMGSDLEGDWSLEPTSPATALGFSPLVLNKC
jgi:hypothetical protein